MISHRAAMVDHPAYLSYDFGPEHPLRPERTIAGLDLLSSAGIWNGAQERLEPPPATDDELELLHDPEFIRVVKAAGTGSAPQGHLGRFGLSSSDNPAFPHMHNAAALVAGGSIHATRQIMSGRLDHAFNAAGGLHHALRSRASGFCIYNDPALAAAVALKKFDARVLYLDFDCHHGDGVQWLFYEEPRVLTVSFHESGRYLFPGTGDIGEIGRGDGVGFSVNVPVAPFTQDDSWLEAVQTIVPPLVESFRPDLIISSHGADTHAWDPLTHICLTTGAFFSQAKLVHELAHSYADGRWLAVGSGGYDWRRVVPRSWAIVWAEMADRPLDERRLPVEWCQRWESESTQPFPATFADDLVLRRPLPQHNEVIGMNRKTVQTVLDMPSFPPKW